MIEFALNASFGLLAAAILCGAFRLVRGPAVLDRILAFDLIAACAVGMVVLLSIRWKTPVYMDLVLIFASLGFFSAVAFVFYLTKEHKGLHGDEAGRAKREKEPTPPKPNE